MKNLFALLAIYVALSMPVFSQVKVTGKVEDADLHSPLKGATVRITGSYTTAYSDAEGNFVLTNLKIAKQSLEISYIGYETKKLEFVAHKDTSVVLLLKKKTVLADEIEIKAVRAGENDPMTSDKMDSKQIAEKNMGQDITYIMGLTPSAVVTSDAGTGVGYTGIRIRGTDPTRINVTINGIPVNDAESQGTYWVDLPDIASLVDNMQIQRGVGTSTNGAGAFGASLNIQTSKLDTIPNATINSSYGSFNTLKNTVAFSTGLIDKKWAFDGRLSKITSDGFIDRAFSDLKSFYVSGGYYGKKSILKLVIFSGKERTYQAWYGVPEARLKNDTAGMNRLYVNGEISQSQYENMLTSNNRTFNIYTYSNQTDNYQQDYYQLLYSYEMNKNWNLNAALHFTKGEGYYEEYIENDQLKNYGLQNVVVNNDTITSTPLIRQLWLNNDFYGFTYSVNYDNHKKIQAVIGGAANSYLGAHYGMVTWVQYASNSFPDLKYYDDTARKNDVNIFCKLNYQLTKKISLYGDVQYRTIYYSFLGFNEYLQNVQQNAKLNFLNPKAGINFMMNNTNSFYASYAVGNKEPGRGDYVQSIPTDRPKPENLQNIEAGYSHKAGKWMLNANYYYMYYKNQLVLTGKINDVGAYNRVNIDKSSRMGIELEAGVKPIDKLDIQANISLSKNKIKNFTEYLDDWDSTAQVSVQHHNTDISFSPAVVAGGMVEYKLLKNLAVSWMSKLVGKQYLDNTSNADRAIDSYFVNDLMLSYSIKTHFIKEIKFSLLVNNVLNELYESNGWTYSYFYGGRLIDENYYFPQAGRNFMVGLSLKF